MDKKATDTSPEVAPSPRGNFRLVAKTQAEEDAYDYLHYRPTAHRTGVIGSVAHMVKGALGAGILSGHVAYMKAGVYVAVPLNVLFGLYMTYCLDLLVSSAQTLYKRTNVPSMSYSDVGEAAMSCFHNKKVSRFAKCFRYCIDGVIIMDLYGSCACYQIIIAKSIKQLVEDTQTTSIEGNGDYPGLRVYMAAMIIPIICICLIRQLKYLAPFSIAANAVILLCVGMTVYYATDLNPSFSNMTPHTTVSGLFEFTGMIVFSMSCAGVVLPVENNMKDPKKFSCAFSIGMSLIVLNTFMVAFFGYAGFLEKSESPITVNFPMTLFPKILKGLIAFMIFITHALNFWVPFNLLFHYLKKRHSENKQVRWEMIYRAFFVVIIALVAIIFPNIDALLGFLGAFCLSLMAFIWPNFITLLVVWHRPGLGWCYWRLWRGILLMTIGLFALICGSIANGKELLATVMEL